MGPMEMDGAEACEHGTQATGKMWKARGGFGLEGGASKCHGSSVPVRTMSLCNCLAG